MMTDIRGALDYFEGQEHLEDASEYALILEEARKDLRSTQMGGVFSSWDEMKARAQVAIAIATPDDRSADRLQPSGNVISEIQQFADQFPNRTIVCREANVTLPDMVDGRAIRELEFRREFGICQCFLDIAQLLADWR